MIIRILNPAWSRFWVRTFHAPESIGLG